MKKRIQKWWTAAVSAVTMLFVMAGPAFADINNPLAQKQGNVDNMLTSVMTWVLGTVAAISGAVFLVFLYLAIGNWIAGSKHAQRREEAKAQFLYVVIAGVLLGGAGTIAGALYHFGQNNLGH